MDRQAALVDSRDVLERFLTEEDLALLDQKPITFTKTEKYNNYNTCIGWLQCVASLGISACFNPLTLCPCIMFPHYSLTLEKDSVKFNSAVNDCCCHVATSQRTVPLEKVQDVELQESWLQTLFGLKQVNVQTAGQGGLGAEVMASFLADPQSVRDAIQLAAKLHRENPTAAPGTQPTMQRGTQGSLLHRLQCLDVLVGREVLSQEQAASMRVQVLAAENDPLHRLREAADLAERQLITQDEFTRLRAALVAGIMAQGGSHAATAYPAL